MEVIFDKEYLMEMYRTGKSPDKNIDISRELSGNILTL